MSRYTASPFGIIPEYLSDFQNFRYSEAQGAEVGTQSSQSQASLFSSNHTIDRTDSNDAIPINYSPKLHVDDLYDLTTTNIIERLKGTKGALKYADFAYCRDFGVYPNNRLIVCRKFSSPIGDDLSMAGSPPVATVISWFDEASLPVTIDFGVDWVDAEGSFKNVLNNMGKDIGLDKIGIQLGDVASKGFNFLPLPGVFEPFTKGIINQIFGKDTVNERTVSGAPNLIKEAKQRKLIPDDQTGSGLIGKIAITVKCSWEQKFIMGKDPTHVYYDLLRAILHFGGEDGTFYAGSNTTAIVKRVLEIMQNPVKFIGAIIDGIIAAIDSLKEKIKKFVSKFFDEQNVPESTADPDFKDTPAGPNGVPPAKTKQENEDEYKAKQTKINDDANQAKNKGNQKNKSDFLGASLGKLLQKGTGGLADKYKHVLLGICSALTGGPSTPWHVTIGNPLKPIFSCGDLYSQGGFKLTLGPTLAFNDLPSSIDLEFTLTGGRTYGIGEIFRKLTTGDIRIASNSAPSFYNNEGKLIEVNPLQGGGSSTDVKDEALSEDLIPSEITSKSKVDSVDTVGSVSTNGAQINSDPGSNPIKMPVQTPNSQNSQLTGGSLITNTQTAGFASSGGFTNPSLVNTSTLTSGSPNFNLDLVGSQNQAKNVLNTDNPLVGLSIPQQSRVDQLNSLIPNTQPSGFGIQSGGFSNPSLGS